MWICNLLSEIVLPWAKSSQPFFSLACVESMYADSLLSCLARGEILILQLLWIGHFGFVCIGCWRSCLHQLKSSLLYLRFLFFVVDFCIFFPMCRVKFSSYVVLICYNLWKSVVRMCVCVWVCLCACMCTCVFAHVHALKKEKRNIHHLCQQYPCTYFHFFFYLFFFIATHIWAIDQCQMKSFEIVDLFLAGGEGVVMSPV